MPRARYVALLRGINVGGRNLIPMSALKTCFEGLGVDDVVTYIQSGNVVFSAAERPAALVRRLEKGLAREFDYDASIVLRSALQLGQVVDGAPPGFGQRPAQYRYDVAFVKEPLTPAEAMRSVSAKPGVDQVFAGHGVLYFERLIAKASQSHLSRLAAKPAYKQMTIRNWNTTNRLLELVTQQARRRV